MIGDIKKALEEAKARGEKQFFANVPCRKYGHNANRSTSSGQCMECSKVKYRENAAANIEKMKRWRAANPEVYKAASRRWKDNNPDSCRNYGYKRRRTLEAGPGFTADQVDAIYNAQGKKCANCLKKITKFHADHVVPIALGGAHAIENIQILCPTCNHRKHKKDPIRWANENGRLL